VDVLKACLLLTLVGCGTPGYLIEQGMGQLKLQWRGEKNEKLLANPNVAEDVKFKIRLIGDAKQFFAYHFGIKVGGIYSKTTQLDGKAVSWLVIASRPTQVEAHEFQFPFVGGFPYIGFFDKADAEDFRRDMEEDGFVTHLRPVYAYSTLGLLEDRILSSFFHFKDVELVELIFHELFHVAFFAKDDVELNENLAQWFANALLDEYFKDAGMLAAYRRKQALEKELEKKLVALAHLLREEFAKMRPYLTDEAANAHARRFAAEILVPVVQEACRAGGWSGDDCPDRVEKWNQARLAALLTYEEEQDFIAALVQRHGWDTRGFLIALKTYHAEWKKNGKGDFSTFLREKALP
jgi:predicted aminopeptidase